MARRLHKDLDFRKRAETFGLETQEPWALEALRIVFHAPRAYEPLVDAVDGRRKGCRRALTRLQDDGWVSYQAPVVADLRGEGEVVDSNRRSRKLSRYRCSAKGKKLAGMAREDYRAVSDLWPRTSDENAVGVARLLEAFWVEDSHAKFGISGPHAIAKSGLADRSGRFWVKKLHEEGYIAPLEDKLADTREVIPGHWRVNRSLCAQLQDVLSAYPQPWGQLASEFKLKRSRFLEDIDPKNLGVSGATDFDHDVQTQRILAVMMKSERFNLDGVFDIEPRQVLLADKSVYPYQFNPSAEKRLFDDTVFYQADCLYTEKLITKDAGGRTIVQNRKASLEYERYQSRRDAWGHIEKFLGWMYSRCLPFESGVLRFVLDSEARLKGYVELIEAYGDWALENREHIPKNPVVMAVCSSERLLKATDALDDRNWFRITLPKGTGEKPVLLHEAEESPYNEYFARKD